MTGDRHRGRLLVLGLLVALVVSASVIDRRASAPAGLGPPPSDRLTVPGPDTLSAAWYCAEGTAAPGERADETVAIANAGDRPVDTVVTVMRGAEAPVVRRVRVGARSRQLVRVADLVRAGEVGVVVETFGGGVAVEHMLSGAGDIAVAPCARQPATRWLFAGGTTVKDAQEFIALFNPFADDAVVDMAFYTDQGLREPEALQGLTVPARSRVSVAVHGQVLRTAIVAADVTTRTGRIVAERSVFFDGSAGRKGLAVSPGFPEPSTQWTFPDGLVVPGVAETLWLANPTDNATTVDVEVIPDGDRAVPPQEVQLPPRAAVTVPLSDKVPQGVGHAVVVRSQTDTPFVAEQALASGPPAPRTGFETVRGVTSPATGWLFPAGSADESYDEWIIVRNPGRSPAHVKITVLAEGIPLVPEGLGDLTVKPGGRGAFRLGDHIKRSDLALVVRADRPVEAERALFTTGISESPGIPFAG